MKNVQAIVSTCNGKVAAPIASIMFYGICRQQDNKVNERIDDILTNFPGGRRIVLCKQI